MEIKLNTKLPELAAFTLACVFVFTLVLFSNGTCDSGDSINHFLFSKYAFKYPELFLNLWNKPVFTLLSAPFAQMGLKGIKVFNALCYAGSLLLVIKICKTQFNANTFLVITFHLASAFALVVHNSGLTEPLFNLGLLYAVYLLLNNKVQASSFIISLLPFIRQEGYLVLAFFLCFFLLKKEWKAVAILFSGHILVTLPGIFVYKKILWIFQNNPNAFYGHYGHGKWLDYFHKLAYILGKPLYLFLAIGVLFSAINFFREKEKIKFLLQEKLVVFWLFLIVVLAHTIFWRYSFFKSMGMERNIITVYGCAVCLAVFGATRLLNLIKHKTIKTTLIIFIIPLMWIYPFYRDPKKVQIPNDFQYLSDEEILIDAASQIKPYLKSHVLINGLPFANFILDRDPFDSINNPGIYKFYPRNETTSKKIVIWDNWLSVKEYGVSIEQLKSDSTLVCIKDTTSGKNTIAIFVSK